MQEYQDIYRRKALAPLCWYRNPVIRSMGIYSVTNSGHHNQAVGAFCSINCELSVHPDNRVRSGATKSNEKGQSRYDEFLIYST